MNRHKKEALARLKRIEGQIRGIQKMVEEDRTCVDILTQASAVHAALRGVERLAIEDHAEETMQEVSALHDSDERRRKLQELIAIITRQG